MFALLLALLAALFVVGPTALAEDSEEEYLDVQAVDVTLDEEFTVNVPADTEECAFIRFTPDQDGFYVFSLTVENEDDPMDWLYYCCFKDHVNKNRDNWFRGAYHRDEIQLEAGNTYYFSLSRTYEGGSGSVNLKLSMHKGLVRADAIGETSLSVAPNSTVPLQVNVQTNDEETELTYRWNASYGYYDDNGDWQWESKSFNEATGPSLTTEPITREIQYECLISDGDAECIVDWLFSVDNQLTIERVNDCDEYGNVANVIYNQPATLEVTGTCSDGEIQYQWYEKKETDEGNIWAPIEGATGTSYMTAPVVSRAGYKVVARDDYGSEEELWFGVSVESEVRAEYAEGQQYTMTVPKDEPVTLKVLATSSIGADLTYQWYRWSILGYDAGEELWEFGEREEIEGATASEYTVEQVTGAVNYYCEVSDGFNDNSLSFMLYPDTNLQATVKDSEDNWTDIKVPLNNTATLEVNARCDEEITYQWFVQRAEYNDDGSYSYGEAEPIPGVDGPTLTTEQVEDRCYYRCAVSDPYENHVMVCFEVFPETHLSATTETGENEQDLYVEPNATPTLTVVASCDDDNLFYTWYIEKYTIDENGEWQMIEMGAIEQQTGPTYTLPPVDGYCNYRCIVRDRFGDSQDVYFHVHVKNVITIERVGEDEISVTKGEAATLEVEVTSEKDVDLQYRWYVLKDTTDEYGNIWAEPVIIPGATDTSYTTDALDAAATYRFLAWDIYGNSAELSFTVSIDTHLQATAKGSEERFARINVSLNEMATLEVDASCEEKITYQWFVQRAEYYDDGSYSYGEAEPVPGVDGPTLTTPQVEDRYNYFCTVSDPYGNNVQVFFEVVPEAHLSAITETGEDEQNLYVEPGATPTLTVVASSDVGDVTYSWTVDTFSMGENGEYDWTGPVEVEGQIGSTITLPPVNLPVSYRCDVRDRLGNEAHVYFNVSVENVIEVEPLNGSAETYVTKGDTATLQVKVTSTRDVALQYSWYQEIETTDEDGESVTMPVPITGANETSYTTELVEKPEYFIFFAHDAYGNVSSQRFYVGLENHLEAEAEQEKVRVAPDSAATLKVIASCDDNSQTYQWYVEEEEEDEDGETYSRNKKIEGETSDTYTVDHVTGKRTYACAVSDSLGNHMWVYFYVETNVELNVEYVSDRTITLKAGEGLELEVYAENGLDTSTFKYQWRYDEEDIEDATGAKFTTDQPRAGEYECQITDEYDNVAHLDFYVKIDNELMVSRVGSIKVPVDEDGGATLAVTASCLKGNLTYEWRDDDYDTMEGETGSTLELTGVEKCGEYTCVVRDDYGNSRYTSFDVVVNGFSVRRVGPRDIWVKKNDSLNLEVRARCDDGDLEYTWYTSSEDDEGEWTDTEIEGATGPILELVNVTGSRDYYCRVRDTHGNEDTAVFCVNVESNLVVDRVSPRTQVAKTGDQVTFEAYVDSPNDDLELLWYYEDADGETVAIEGATGTTYSFTVAADSPKYYTFDVYDPEDERSEAVTFTLLRNDSVQMLELDVPAEATIEHRGGSVCFSFTPTQTGTYTIVSRAKGTETDTCVTLYNSNWEELAYNDDGPKDVNFSLTYMLEADETYYYMASWLSDSNTGAFPVVLSEGGTVEPDVQSTLTLTAGSSTVRTGEDLELTIEKTGYFWSVDLVLADDSDAMYVLDEWVEPEDRTAMEYYDAFDEPQEMTFYAVGWSNGEEVRSEPVTVQVVADGGELAKPTLKVVPDGNGMKVDYTMPEHAANMRIRVNVDGKLYDRWTTASGSWVVAIPQLSGSDMVIVSAEADASAVGYVPSTAVANAIIGGEATDVLTLPTGLKEIGEEAFVNMAAEAIMVPDGCLSIGKRAFADCDGLRMVYLPDSVESIAVDAFSGSGQVTIYCASDNAAAEFARANGIPYVIQ